VVSHKVAQDSAASGFAVVIHQVVRDLQGELFSHGRVAHAHEMGDRIVVRMDIEQPE
jgi:hypothetical protein